MGWKSKRTGLLRLHPIFLQGRKGLQAPMSKPVPVSGEGRKVKRLRDTWTTAICKPQCNPDWLSLILNTVDAKKFKLGDKVRVTVTLLERQS
jgi:hypothetical protein